MIIVGASKHFQNQIPLHLHEKVSLFLNKARRSVDSLVRSMVSPVRTSAVYMSIDKDVLDRTEAVTNWDQGTDDR